jgi:hypothetical protein
MKIISLGCNCDVGYFIQKYFPQTYDPFDWLWSNIDFIINTFENEYFEFTECEKLNAVWITGQPYTYIFNNQCKGDVERKCSAISLHDANNLSPNEYYVNIPNINEKHQRRFSRLCQFMKNENEEIIFIRKVLYKTQGAVKMIPDSIDNLKYLNNLLKEKYKAKITFYIVDDDNCLEDITSFPENLIVVNSFHQLFPLLSKQLEIMDI